MKQRGNFATRCAHNNRRLFTPDQSFLRSANLNLRVSAALQPPPQLLQLLLRLNPLTLHLTHLTISIRSAHPIRRYKFRHAQFLHNNKPTKKLQPSTSAATLPETERLNVPVFERFDV